MTDAPLTVSLANLPDTRLAQLARDLERDLSRSGVRARSPEATATPGERGEPVTVGVLVLALITHGAATALINCLKTYLAREPTLTVKLKRPGGTQLEVTARNVDTQAVREAVEAVASAGSH